MTENRAGETTTNFNFLRPYDPRFTKYARLAEDYLATDPQACLVNLRKFGEVTAENICLFNNMPIVDERFHARLVHKLYEQNLIPSSALELFVDIRDAGNWAAHSHPAEGSKKSYDALEMMHSARSLGAWFHRQVSGNKVFIPPTFVIPPGRTESETRLLKQLVEANSKLHVERKRADTASERLQGFVDNQKGLVLPLPAWQATRARPSQP